MKTFWSKARAAGVLGLLAGLLAVGGCRNSDSNATQPGANSVPAEPIRIGFLVKLPDEAWFQDEWKFAQQAADKDGFRLIKIGATNDEEVLTAIDNLAAQHAQGFVICTPDVHLGPAIVARAKEKHLKVMSVDDQFVGRDGAFMTEVPYMGIAAHEIGETVGKALYAEMTRRDWAAQETGACVITYDELATSRGRTEGAIDALLTSGFPKGRIFKGHERTENIPGGFDAGHGVLADHPAVKNWLVCGVNDEAVLGAVHALRQGNIAAENIIGVGIGGDPNVADFTKEQSAGFYATVLINWRRHGYETADQMYHWIKDGTAPPTATYTGGILVTRENHERILKEQGLVE